MQKFTAYDGKEYPVSDRVDLTNKDWIANLNSIVRFLEGEHHSKFTCSREQPFETIDQVHGQLWHPDTCGCIFKQVFPHWDAHAYDHTKGSIPVHPHRTHKSCDRHKHLLNTHGHKGHHDHVFKEHKAINNDKEHWRAVVAIADGLAGKV